MEVVQSEQLQIRAARPHERDAALKLALACVPESVREALTAQTLAKAAEGEPLDGLLLAQRGERVVGALYCEVQLGRSAGIWPPQIALGEADDEGVSRRLLQAAVVWLGTQNVRIVQAMLAADGGRDAQRLRAGGFTHLTDLLYLVSLQAAFPTTPPATRVTFEPTSTRSDAELALLVEGTYEQTLDCPALNGVQDCADALASYRGASSFDPALWFVVRHEQRDAGCLLLADFADSDQRLLVYMGLLPEARGKGLGIEVVRYAQWLCAQSGRGRLILAVDAANKPAIDIYAAAGFVIWDRRSVWLHVLET